MPFGPHARRSFVARLAPAALATFALAACVDLTPKTFDRDFGPASPAVDQGPAGGSREAGPPTGDSGPSGGDAARPGADARTGGADAAPHPDDCPALADCTGRVCGADPVCGTSCGICPLQTTCREGRCECVADCGGRNCGSDGCSGTCGDCGDGSFCVQGRCQPVPPGCPDLADCGGRVCGPDPVCGTECGVCGEGFACRDGSCVCVPRCDGRECGDDQCQGVCGACPVGETCTDGRCVAPPPECPDLADCGELACGPDPVCGVLCGRCAADELCRNGRCICAPHCGERVCGEDGCGGACGTCIDGLTCQDGQCVCVRQCDGRVCGDDGCGGECGRCAAGETCNSGGLCGCGAGRCGATCCGPEHDRCAGDFCCRTHWRTSLPLDRGGPLLVDGQGRAFVGARDGDDAFLASVFTCEGTVDAVVPVQHPAMLRGAAVFGLELVGNDLLVSGRLGDRPAESPQGFFARYSRPGLQQQWLQPLFGGAEGVAEVWDLALDEAGRVLMAGTTGQPAFWAIAGTAQGLACGWTAGFPGLGRAASFGHGGVWMTGSVEDRLALVAYDANCRPLPIGDCQCAPFVDARGDLPDALYSEGRAVVAGRDRMYVAGFANRSDAPNDLAGVIMAAQGVDPPSLVSRWDPSPLIDGYMGMAIAGDRAYLAGFSGLVDPRDSYDAGVQGHLVVVDLLNGRVETAWPLGPGPATSVALEGDGVVVVLAHQTTTEVIRCPLDGPCP